MQYAPRRMVLDGLVRSVGETCNVGTLDANEIVYLDRVEAKHWPLRLQFGIGSRVPLHCTAVGKLFLAFVPARQRRELLAGLDLCPMTAATLTDRQALQAELAAIRARGLSWTPRNTSWASSAWRRRSSTARDRYAPASRSRPPPPAFPRSRHVPVIVDETADLARATELICASKVFDNATSCSSENAVVVVDAVYGRMMAEFPRVGGVMASAAQKSVMEGKLWVGGKLSRHLIAKDGVGPAHPFSGEKLSLVLAVYRAADFAAAGRRVSEILAYQGVGHSRGIHTAARTGRG